MVDESRCIQYDTAHVGVSTVALDVVRDGTVLGPQFAIEVGDRIVGRGAPIGDDRDVALGQQPRR